MSNKLKLTLGAWADLWQRYWQVFRHAWSERAQTDTKALLGHESEFLPAALSLQETPVSPAPRVAMWLIMTFATIAVLWACFGYIDIVATAEGKIVPNDRSKIIQSFEVSTVKAIHVKDGQHVKAGDVLVELDGTMTEAERERIAGDLATYRLQVSRARAFIEALDDDRQPIMSRPVDVSDALWLESLQFLGGQYSEYRSKLALLDADIVKKHAEASAIQAEISKLEKTLPIVTQRAKNFNKLSNEGNLSQDIYLQREQDRIETEGELASNRGKLTEVTADLKATEEQKNALLAETRRTQLDSLNDGVQKAKSLEQELIKANSRNELMRLVAPVDGTVQQLAIHTVGGVVTEAQALMVIVPEDNALEVEAMLENKDIGFVNPDQEAEIKVQTFQYTKYGTIHGHVINVSNDAINDEKRGLIFSSRIHMDKNTMQVEGKTVTLSPGMVVTVEIKTGKRRLIEYFLNPLLQYKKESLRER